MRKIDKFNYNSFGFLRLIAALFVLFTHCFELVGDKVHEPLYNLSGGKIRFSTIGLYMFFFTSGFLVTHSFLQTKTTGEFIWKRFLRIYPGLIVVVLLTVFVVGPFFTSLSFQNYFTNIETWKYLETLSGFQIKFILPEVFNNSNHIDQGVNGSLWSIGHEIKLYIILVFAGLLYKKGMKAVFYLITTGVLIFNFLVDIDLFHLQNYFDPLHTNLFFTFWVGCICFIHYKKIILSIWIFFLFFLMWLICIFYFPLSRFIIDPLFFSYFTLICCYTKKTVSLKIDLSYGIYIYAFLITQILIEILNPIRPFILMIYLSLCIVPVSLLSWFFIEKKALAQKSNVPKTLFGLQQPKS